jgi:hypothetical protein
MCKNGDVTKRFSRDCSIWIHLKVNPYCTVESVRSGESEVGVEYSRIGLDQQSIAPFRCYARCITLLEIESLSASWKDPRSVHIMSAGDDKNGSKGDQDAPANIPLSPSAGRLMPMSIYSDPHRLRTG